MNLATLDDDDAFPTDGRNVGVSWIHGLLRGISETPASRQARLDLFVSRLRDESKLSIAPDRRKVQRFALVGSALAASILFGLIMLLSSSGRAQANAEAIVRQAQQALSKAVDRCYHVQWESRPGLETISPSTETNLWTRGDRFWMPIHGRRLACGRDERGSIWVVRTAQLGIRFDAGETDIPPQLAVTCAVCTMQIETILRDVLRDFDLTCEPTSTNNAEIDTIDAHLKSGHTHPSLLSARLEIDRRTHVVQQLVLEKSQTTVTYTLIATDELLPDDQYRLEGHLEPGAHIFTRSLDPEMRKLKLREAIESPAIPEGK